MVMKMNVLEIKSLYKKFDKDFVLDDVNITIQEGEAVSIIGPSGSGKSTLLRIISSLEKASKGNIKLFGKDIMKDNKYIKYKENVFKEVGFIFQDFNLFDNLNVKDNIELAPKLMKMDNIENKTIELLKLVNLSDKIKNYPNQLSGGEKQRIAIARALALNPKFILFDEPTSALDVENIRDLVYTINELKNKGITLLIVTHDLNFASSVSSRLVFMEKAKIIEDSERIDKFMKMR